MPSTFTRERVIIVAVIVAIASICSFRAVYEPDLWWHLAQGREDLAGRFVRANVFSFLYPDYRQHFTSWLFDCTAYVAWQAGGGAGIQSMQAVLLILTLGLVYAAARMVAPAAASLAVVLIGAVILEPRAIPRPFLVSFAGMAAVTLLIGRAAAARSARPLWPAVPLVALWSNFHVESIFGVALLGLFAVMEVGRPSALPRRQALAALGIAALCGLALVATPYGVGIVRYFRENAALPGILDIVEVQPPGLPAYRGFYAYLVILGVLLLAFPRVLRPWELLAAVVFGVLGARYLRLTPLVFLVTAPMVAARVGLLMARGLTAAAVTVTAVAAAVLLSRVPITRMAAGIRTGGDAMAPAPFFSAGAIAYARTHGLRGAMFNSNNLGGYLAWSLYPDARIFQDSRLQAYPPEHFVAILRAARSQSEWDELLGGLQWAVLSVPRPNTLSGAGRFPANEWATVFADDAMEIVVRRGGDYAHLVTQ